MFYSMVSTKVRRGHGEPRDLRYTRHRRQFKTVILALVTDAVLLRVMENVVGKYFRVFAEKNLERPSRRFSPAISYYSMFPRNVLP